MKEKRLRTPHANKRLITLNRFKRLRQWTPPAPGWNARRCLLETGAEGGWFTSTAVVRAHGIPRHTLTYHFHRMLKLGQLERRRIEGRPTAPHWTREDRAEASRYPGMFVMRAKARWAYRLTYAGIAALEDLRAGKRDIIGRRRSETYRILAEWLPGRGAVSRRAIKARLGNPTWDALCWCRSNYGTPWPVYGRPGYWEWKVWPVEDLFS